MFQASIAPAATDSNFRRDPISNGVVASASDPRQRRAQSIRAVLQQRRRRSDFFDTRLFSDPAWDILLALYSAQLDQRRVSIAALCRRGGIAGTTALRWLALFETQELTTRRPDPLDGRRVYLELSVKGVAAMDAYFDGVWLSSEVV